MFKFTAIIGIALVPVLSHAQVIEIPRVGATGIAFEALHPNLSDEDASILTAAYYLSGHHQISSRALLVFQLPVAYSSISSVAGSSSTIGNPYVGIALSREKSSLEFGVRFPLASEDEEATFVGVFTDAMRMEAFLPDVLSARVSARQDFVRTDRAAFGMQIAPVLLVPTGDGSDPELIVNYSAGVSVMQPQARFHARAGGGLIVTEAGRFAERTLHQLGIAADFGPGRVRPGAYLSVPLDADYQELVDIVFGLTLQINVGR